MKEVEVFKIDAIPSLIPTYPKGYHFLRFFFSLIINVSTLLFSRLYKLSLRIPKDSMQRNFFLSNFVYWLEKPIHKANYHKNNQSIDGK